VFTRRGAAVEPTLTVRRPLIVTAQLKLGDAVNLNTGERRTLDSFGGRGVHAVAGIGHPEAFFGALRSAGLDVTGHALADHATLDPGQLPFPAAATVLMTAKDAVKCRSFAGADWWFVELGVHLDRTAANDWLAQILERVGLAGAGVNRG
jgi:tetraacyldisaccharide 4'-kinase